MDPSRLETLLTAVREGTLPVAEALGQLRSEEDLGFARVDHDREHRCGFPEVVFCQGKEPAQAALIAGRIFTHSGRVLLTRADEKVHQEVVKELPQATWHAEARCITATTRKPETQGLVLVLCAGTADLPVAEEARITAWMSGAKVEPIYDVGVAGIHRLLAHHRRLQEARALVVVAGMEGALPSVVAGLVDRPVVAVPTSVGYGASFGGLSALLTMLNSCAAGIAVTNIDNGFGGGYLAALINRNSR